MIDPKMLPNDPDAWRKPDTSEPRPTADFINDVWACRKAPVYSLRPKELEILQGKTFKGWLWRLIMRLLRYSRPTSISLQADAYGTATATNLVCACDPCMKPESERTMEHYLAIAKKFMPQLRLPKQKIDPNTCDSSEWHQVTKIKFKNPKKPTKNERKSAPKKSRKR